MSSTVNCDYTGANWEFNSEGENPCMVYAELQGECDSAFTIAQVTSTSPPYSPPNNACGCNVVAYNLQAACGWCQSTIQPSWWLTVNQWAGNCTSSTYNTNSISSSVSTSSINIPAWALVPPTGTSWSPSQASAIAVPSSATGSSTTLPFGSSTSRYSYSYPSYSYTYNSGDYPWNYYASTSVNVGAIAAGVIFGLYGLLLIIVAIAFFVRQKRRKALYGPMGRYYSAQRGFGGAPGAPGYGFPPYTPNQNTAAAVPLLYDPNTYNNGTPANNAYPGTPSTAAYQIAPNTTGTTSSQGYQPPPPEGYNTGYNNAPGGYQPPPIPDQHGAYGAPPTGVPPNTNSMYGAPNPNTMSMYGTPPPNAPPNTGGNTGTGYKGHAEVY